MELDLADVLKGAPPLTEQAANDQSDYDRLVAVVTQQQEGINMLTDILVKQKAEIEVLKIDIRMLKARTAPAKSAILKPGDRQWPNLQA